MRFSRCGCSCGLGDQGECQGQSLLEPLHRTVAANPRGIRTARGGGPDRLAQKAYRLNRMVHTPVPALCDFLALAVASLFLRPVVLALLAAVGGRF